MQLVKIMQLFELKRAACCSIALQIRPTLSSMNRTPIMLKCSAAQIHTRNTRIIILCTAHVMHTCMRTLRLPIL